MTSTMGALVARVCKVSTIATTESRRSDRPGRPASPARIDVHSRDGSPSDGSRVTHAIRVPVGRVGSQPATDTLLPAPGPPTTRATWLLRTPSSSAAMRSRWTYTAGSAGTTNFAGASGGTLTAATVLR